MQKLFHICMLQRFIHYMTHTASSLIPQTVLALRGSYGVGKAGAMDPAWIRSRHAFALKHCKLQYKVDVTPPNATRNRWSRPQTL